MTMNYVQNIGKQPMCIITRHAFFCMAMAQNNGSNMNITKSLWDSIVFCLGWKKVHKALKVCSIVRKGKSKINHVGNKESKKKKKANCTSLSSYKFLTT